MSGDRFGHLRFAIYCIVQATLENALFAFVPINLTVPMTSARITATITAYSTMSYPSCAALRNRQYPTNPSLLRWHCENQHSQDCQDEACDKRKQGAERMCAEIAIAGPPKVNKGLHDHPPATIRQQTRFQSLAHSSLCLLSTFRRDLAVISATSFLSPLSGVCSMLLEETGERIRSPRDCLFCRVAASGPTSLTVLYQALD